MAVDGTYDQLDLQQIDDAIYEDVAKTKKEIDLLTILQSESRRFKRVAVGAGLLCAVLALLNVAVPLSLYTVLVKESNNLVEELEQINTRDSNLTVENGQLQISFEQLQITHGNLTVENGQLQIRVEQLQISRSNLTEEKDLLETRFKQLEIRYKNVTEELDALKRRFCESDGFTFADGLCYYVSTVEKNWDQSRRDCRAKQSDLMVTKSKEKRDFVASLNRRLWLGLTDRDEEGDWKWLDGTPESATSEFWADREPNNSNNEDCADTVGGRWSDLSCYGPSNLYICERVI